jgi:hypothetical protein
MTTSSFGTPLAPAPPVGAPGGRPTGPDEAAQASRRNVIVLALVAAALALGAGVYFLLFAGSGEADVVAAPPVAPAPAAAAPAPSPSVVPTPVVRQKAVTARNPFTALVVQAPPAAAAGAPTTQVPGTTTPAQRVPVSQVPVRIPTVVNPGRTTVPRPVPVPGTVPGSVPVVPAARPAPVTVKLGAVSEDNTVARLTVGTKVLTVEAGAEFGKDQRLLNLRDGSCGAVQLGGVVVDLCEGKSYTTR